MLSITQPAFNLGDRDEIRSVARESDEAAAFDLRCVYSHHLFRDTSAGMAYVLERWGVFRQAIEGEYRGGGTGLDESQKYYAYLKNTEESRKVVF